MKETKNNSGITGTLTWNLTGGILTINGTGAMSDYSEWPEAACCTNRAPNSTLWKFCRKSITTVTIGSGITSIGKNAFCACHSLSSLVIPGSVKSIGDNAFEYCCGLTSIDLCHDSRQRNALRDMGLLQLPRVDVSCNLN
ncbi:MAG: leucine-rich repeat domain-containing protein [Tannerella sp.]|jgi:hypothetical protein|nr:leucine-rich repeat domain-containing protein [Tannerella sp.]